MTVKYWVDQMATDSDVKIWDRREEMFDMELEKFLTGQMRILSTILCHNISHHTLSSSSEIAPA